MQIIYDIIVAYLKTIILVCYGHAESAETMIYICTIIMNELYNILIKMYITLKQIIFLYLIYHNFPFHAPYNFIKTLDKST